MGRRSSAHVFGSSLSFSLVCVAVSAVRIDLDGAWQLTNSNRSIMMNSTVPGSVLASFCPVRTNFEDSGSCRIHSLPQGPMETCSWLRHSSWDWVGLEEWTFSRTFKLTVEQTVASRAILTPLRLRCARWLHFELKISPCAPRSVEIFLHCDGLATVSVIRVNNQAAPQFDRIMLSAACMRAQTY